jgi:putative acetyltransferase
MNHAIRAETPADAAAIRDINCQAFGQPAEADLVEALRAGGYPRLSLVAERDGRVVGHIMFSDLPIVAAAGTVPALALAPMAVLPQYQRQGVGSSLVQRGLDRCRDAGHRVVVVLGHRAYYPRFGFSPELALRLESPYAGPSFMALELVAGALDGVTGRVEYPPPFSRF